MKINVECQVNTCQNRLWTYYSPVQDAFDDNLCESCLQEFHERVEKWDRELEQRNIQRRAQERERMRKAGKFNDLNNDL